MEVPVFCGKISIFVSYYDMDLQALKNKYDIIGNDPALNDALETAVKFAPTGLSVLIQGESGVGKESFARIIHQFSPRRQGQFFVVNCGALPKELVNSELFGHVKGSFTGATDTRKGYFEEADGGTLFLDEIAELPLEARPSFSVSSRAGNTARWAPIR